LESNKTKLNQIKTGKKVFIMKATESFVHKNLRAVAQASVRKEASEPCSLFWSYQPHRPEKPLTNSQEKK